MFEHRPFGNRLKLVVRGASHAPAIEFELENFPADVKLDPEEFSAFMERRAPGRDPLSTARRETDRVEWLSGIRENVTDGRVIVGRIANSDIRPRDYGSERTVPRPGHADYGQWIEQGRIPTGGGANSGRLTAAYCAAGGLCRQFLRRRGIAVHATLECVGGQTQAPEAAIAAARADGDSVGGIIRCSVTGIRPGLGGAMFAGVESELASAVFGIPGVKGLEFGNGFAAAELRGSENNDAYAVTADQVITRTNRHGGVLGGRTTGMPLEFRVAMKPTPTIFKPLESVELRTMTAAECVMKGRHDPCIVRRALPVVEAVTAFVVTDLILATEAATARICLTLTGNTLAEDWQQYLSQRPWTDLVELRVDRLIAAERTKVRDFIARFTVPVIVTFRRQTDGGEFSGPESERIEFYRELLSGSLPPAPEVMVDFESDFRIDELARLAREHQVRIIRSLHVFAGSVPTTLGSVPKLIAGTKEIAKLALTLENADEVADFIQKSSLIDGVPHVICGMGKVAMATRTLAVRTGSLWTYASAGGLETLGHLTPQELVRDYRLRVQTKDFSLYGVTGWPLSKTRSPELHNAAFAASDQDAIMVSFPAAAPESAVAAIRKLNIRGMAVTIPHKERILPFLDEISPTARAIGAVNTVLYRDGRLLGYNTDADGFTAALTKFLGREDLVGTKVAVLGAGGAAKAVIFALKRLKAQVEVFHRRPLAAGFEVIVNATPVDPIPEYQFTGREAVYDLVYVPEVTPLMTRAAAAGCRTENGLSMLTAQAELQRKIWGCQ